MSNEAYQSITPCHIEYKDISALIDKCQDLYERFMTIGTVHKGIIDKINEFNMSGKISDNIKNYFNEVHGTLLNSLYLALQEYYTQIVLYSKKFNEVEVEPTAVIDEEYLYEIKIEMETF